MRLVAGLCLIAALAGAQPVPTKAPALTKAQLMGRVDPARDPAFAAVEEKFLRKPVAEAYERMKAAAARDGVALRLVSATRTFADQRGIWERKWAAIDAPAVERALKIMRYSSMPGTSRHHWGTDLDLNSVSPRWFNDTAEGRKVYGWLQAHAKDFGFCQPYTAKGPARPTGYAEEKWHWSYQPLSSAFLTQYLATVKAADIAGFSGSGTAAAVRSIEDFVGGVDGSCR